MCGRRLDPEDMDVKVESDLIAHTNTVPEQVKKRKDLKGEHNHMWKLYIKKSEAIHFANFVS